MAVCSLGISLAGAATSIIFVAIKVLSRQPCVCVCRDKTRLLSRQKYACRDKIMFVAANTCTFVSTKGVFLRVCRDKSKLVATKIMFVATNICRDKNMFCRRDKHNFVATKMILVAAPANDGGGGGGGGGGGERDGVGGGRGDAHLV